MKMDAPAFLAHVSTQPYYRDQIVHVEHIPPRDARYGELEIPLPPELRSRLESAGLMPLYSHQSTALNALRRGQNVIMATPSASGKSLCYNLAVLEAI